MIQMSKSQVLYKSTGFSLLLYSVISNDTQRWDFYKILPCCVSYNIKLLPSKYIRIKISKLSIARKSRWELCKLARDFENRCNAIGLTLFGNLV